MCLSVLLRLIAGPVTNHDSSARERRGHTTLGSVSGACCHPLRLTGHPPVQLLRFPTKSVARDRRAAALSSWYIFVFVGPFLVLPFLVLLASPRDLYFVFLFFSFLAICFRCSVDIVSFLLRGYLSFDVI